MIAIRVRYCSATNHRPARWQASDGRHVLYIPVSFEDEDKEKLNAATQFKLKYLPHSPELNPTPSQFNGDCYFSFYPKGDPEKLEELLSKFGSTYGVSNPIAIEMIRAFVKQNCILK